MKTIQITLECLTSDTGDRTFRVTSRYGKSGENPPVNVLHDSHYAESALAELRRAARAAVSERFAAITVPGSV